MNLRQAKPRPPSASTSQQRSATRVAVSPCAFGSHIERVRTSSPRVSVSPRRKLLEASLTPRGGQAPYVIRRAINFNDESASEHSRSATSRRPTLVEEQAQEIEHLQQRLRDSEKLIHEQNEEIEKLHRSCSDLKLEIEALIASRRSELYEELELLQDSSSRRRAAAASSTQSSEYGADSDDGTAAPSPMIDEFIRSEYDRSNGRAADETASPQDLFRHVGKDVVNLLRSLATQIFIEKTRRLDLEEGHGILKDGRRKKKKKSVKFVDSACTASEADDDTETSFQSMLDNPEDSFFQLSGPCNKLHIALARSERNVVDATFEERSYHEDLHESVMHNLSQLPRDPLSDCKAYINYFRQKPQLTTPSTRVASSFEVQNTSHLVANLKMKYAL